jgi:hypothetical protein
LRVRAEDISVKALEEEELERRRKSKAEVVRECLRNGVYDAEDIIEKLDKEGLAHGCLVKYVETERANFLRDRYLLKRLRKRNE